MTSRRPLAQETVERHPAAHLEKNLELLAVERYTRNVRGIG
jgi:hypothetical protein